MMRYTVVSNEFYVSKFLMRDLDAYRYDVLYEGQIDSRVSSKFLARVLALFSSVSRNDKQILVFAIEDVILLDKIYRTLGKPKIWLWNPLSSMTLKNRILFLLYVKLKKIQVWTFDRFDSEKYGFSFFPQVHSKALISAQAFSGSGAFFSGVDKGRLTQILEIRKALVDVSVNVLFHIVADKGKSYSENEKSLVTHSYIDFSKYMESVRKCSIVIDVGQPGQVGLTLRVMEAVFLNKKLITTNISVKSFDFYRSSNIYVYGHEKRSIEEFLLEPYIELPEDIKMQYTLEKLFSSMIQ